MSFDASYIKKRGRRFHYKRRIPIDYQECFTSSHIEVALKTDSLDIAKQRASILASALDSLFVELGKLPSQADERLSDILLGLKRKGFNYYPYEQLAKEAPLHAVVNQVHVAQQTPRKEDKQKILVANDGDIVKISDCAELLFKYERIKLSKKTDDELRKYKNPVLKAFKNFTTLVGDKAVSSVTRSDMVKLKDWWMDRVVHQNMATNSANRDFSSIKKGIRIANDRFELGLNTSNLFIDISLRDEQKVKRAAFKAEFIQDVILTHEYQNLSPEIKLFIFAMADTGCRIKELVGLEAQDIVLDADIPHIHIQPNDTRLSMKTATSVRTLPLVGSALYAFQHLRQGFVDYRARNDAMSAAANKYMKDNGLLPSSQHTLYSFRHSLKDRLTAIEAPKNIETMLMGHSTPEPNYGDGASLAQKYKWMQRIAFTV